jgi:hypothetical protein
MKAGAVMFAIPIAVMLLVSGWIFDCKFDLVLVSSTTGDPAVVCPG